MIRLPTSFEILKDFKQGWDTYDISKNFSVPESVIYHLLAKARKNDPDKNGAAIAAQCKQIMADKRKRAGLPILKIYRVEESCSVVRVNTGKKTKN